MKNGTNNANETSPKGVKEMGTLTARWNGEMVAYASRIGDAWWVTNARSRKFRKVGSRSAAYTLLMTLNRPRGHNGEYNAVIVQKR